MSKAEQATRRWYSEPEIEQQIAAIIERLGKGTDVELHMTCRQFDEVADKIRAAAWAECREAAAEIIVGLIREGGSAILRGPGAIRSLEAPNHE